MFQRRINLQPDNVEHVVKASCILHNFVQTTNTKQMDERPIQNLQDEGASYFMDSEVHGSLQRVTNVGGNRPTGEALRVRETFKDYFSSEAGRIPWQQNIVQRGRRQNLI